MSHVTTDKPVERKPNKSRSTDKFYKGTMKKHSDTEIVNHLIKIIGNGTFTIETINESVLVKMLELRGTPIPLEKNTRDYTKDYKMWMEDK